MPRKNRYLEAFKESYNTVGLASVVALSAALLNPLPLLAGMVAEAVYLLFVPDSRWYEARLSRRYDAEVEQRRQKLKAQVLPTLRPEMQERFRRLEAMRQQIGAQPIEDAHWFREVLRKLDYLLEKFLLFATKEAEAREYLHSELLSGRTDPRSGQASFELPPMPSQARPAPHRNDAPPSPPAKQASPPLDASDRWTQQTVGEIQNRYQQEMRRIRALLAQTPEDTQAVLAKRLDVLQRRHDYIEKSGNILMNLNHQLQLVEDTFGLINDELRARSPEQVLADVEEVVTQTDTMTQALEEIASFEQMLTRMAV